MCIVIGTSGNHFSYSKGVRAKPHKWQLQQQQQQQQQSNAPNPTSEPKESSASTSQLGVEKTFPTSTASLAVPDETDLRPGIKNNGQSSPNLLRRRTRGQRQRSPMSPPQEETANHKRTVSLQDIIHESYIPEVGVIHINIESDFIIVYH